MNDNIHYVCVQVNKPFSLFSPDPNDLPLLACPSLSYPLPMPMAHMEEALIFIYSIIVHIYGWI